MGNGCCNLLTRLGKDDPNQDGVGKDQNQMRNLNTGLSGKYNRSPTLPTVKAGRESDYYPLPPAVTWKIPIASREVDENNGLINYITKILSNPFQRKDDLTGLNTGTINFNTSPDYKDYDSDTISPNSLPPLPPKILSIGAVENSQNKIYDDQQSTAEYGPGVYHNIASCDADLSTKARNQLENIQTPIQADTYPLADQSFACGRSTDDQGSHKAKTLAKMKDGKYARNTDKSSLYKFKGSLDDLTQKNSAGGGTDRPRHKVIGNLTLYVKKKRRRRRNKSGVVDNVMHEDVKPNLIPNQNTPGMEGVRVTRRRHSSGHSGGSLTPQQGQFADRPSSTSGHLGMGPTHNPRHLAEQQWNHYSAPYQFFSTPSGLIHMMRPHGYTFSVVPSFSQHNQCLQQLMMQRRYSENASHTLNTVPFSFAVGQQSRKSCSLSPMSAPGISQSKTQLKHSPEQSITPQLQQKHLFRQPSRHDTSQKGQMFTLQGQMSSPRNQAVGQHSKLTNLTRPQGHLISPQGRMTILHSHVTSPQSNLNGIRPQSYKMFGK